MQIELERITVAELPFFPLATDAYLADCGHLSDAEHGRYLLILMALWRAPGQRLPNDDEWLARRFGRDVERVQKELRPLIEEFCKSSGNWITQKRLTKEWDYVIAGRKKQSVRAKVRWDKEKEECPGNASSGIASSGNAPTPTPTPTPTPIKKDMIPRQARKTTLQEDWEPIPELLAYAAAQGCVDPNDTAERFKLHHQSKGTLHANWIAAFQYWCRNEKNFARPTSTKFATAFPAAVTTIDDGGQWTARLRGWQQSKFWKPYDWGPEPGHPRCLVPPHLLPREAA